MAKTKRISCPVCRITIDVVLGMVEGQPEHFWFVAEHRDPVTRDYCAAAGAEYDVDVGQLA